MRRRPALRNLPPLLFLVVAAPQEPPPENGDGRGGGAPRSGGTAEEREEKVRRGEYLALRVAQCVQCHSPRDEEGELIPTQLFEGAAIPVAGPDGHGDWAQRAPALAGLAGHKADVALSVLTEGHRPDGRAPRPPMPPFRLEREDAEAVVAYLGSLGGEPPGAAPPSEPPERPDPPGGRR